MTSRPAAVDGARITGPRELLQAVPYLLGFHPHASLVLIGLRDRRLVVTSRLDLRDSVRGGVAHAVEAMVRGGTTAFVAVVYDDAALFTGAGELPWADLASTVAEVVDGGGAQLRDALLVSGRRWWSFACSDEACCPVAGRELAGVPSAFTTAATVDGLVVLPDRAALEALLDPEPDDVRAALEPSIAAAERSAVRRAIDGSARRWELAEKRALFKAAREAGEIGWPGPSGESAARFGSALRVTAVRDAVWLAIDHRRLDGRALWRDLGRRLPAPYDAAALFLYGWASWRAGSGALARTAAERALRSDPGYTAAQLLHSAVGSGVDPHRVPRLRPPRNPSAGSG